MLRKKVVFSCLALVMSMILGNCSKDSGGSDVNTALSAPAGVTVTAQTATTVTLVWSAVADAATYSVYRSTSLSGSYVGIMIGTTDLTMTDRGLDQATGYYYAVAASNAGGEGPRSAAVGATTANVVVSTLAGSGAQGSADGTGASATFYEPTGIAVDSSGTVYVSDCLNHTIRSITSAGVVSTLAGSAGSPGSMDGTGASASFNYPSGLAVDWSGTVYVADLLNQRIRSISSGGYVGIYMSSGFNYPSGVAVDNSGNVYVADSNGNSIRKISYGYMTTLAGNGGTGSQDGYGTSAMFNLPTGVAVDFSGNVFVADSQNNKIRKIDPNGYVTTFAGSGAAGSADGTGTKATFNRPIHIAVDYAGYVYVSDRNNNKIRKISPSGRVTTLAGTGTSGYADGNGLAAAFNLPSGIAVDQSGNIYVSDCFNNVIRKLTQ